MFSLLWFINNPRIDVKQTYNVIWVDFAAGPDYKKKKNRHPPSLFLLKDQLLHTGLKIDNNITI